MDSKPAEDKSWPSPRSADSEGRGFATSISQMIGRFRGRLDYRFAKKEYLGALNNQQHRKKIVAQLFERLQFSAIVETGTYRGETTKFLSGFGLPVYSIEINPRYFEFSRLRLQELANVQLLEGNSGVQLRSLVGSPAIGAGTNFFYLDAHWHDHLPLPDELEAIFSTQNKFVVMIDDFEVPGDDEYGFDAYPSGVLNLALLRSLADRDYTIFFPSVPASQETGYRRGCVIIARGDSVVSAMLGFDSIVAYSLESEAAT